MADQKNDIPSIWYWSEGGKDLLTAICILLFAICGFLFINPNEATVYPGDGGITWQTLPLAYAGMLAFLSVIYMFQSVRKMRQEALLTRSPKASDDEIAKNKVIWIRRILSIVILLIFVSLLKILGLAIMAPVFLFSLFRLYKRGQWGSDLLIACIGGLSIWILFVPVLKMNLKGGDLDLITPLLLGVLNSMGVQ